MIWNQTKPINGSKVDFSHPLARGLVGCWLFNEGQGDKVYDISGNQNHGTLTGFSHPATVTSGWNPGKFGKGLLFNGTNNALSLPVNLSNGGQTSIVFSYRKNVSFASRVLYMRYATTGNGGYIYCDGSGWEIAAFKGITPNRSASAFVPSLLKTHHYIVTFDRYTGTSPAVSLNVNGNLITLTQTRFDIIGNNFDNGNLSVFNYAGSLYGEGLLDYIIVYNRKLQDNESKQLYISPFCFIN